MTNFAFHLFLWLISLETPKPPLQLEMELTGAEYASLIRQGGLPQPTVRSQDLSKIMALGEKNLDWLKFINEHLPEGHLLSFTSPENTMAFPMSDPKKYNPEILLKQFDDLKEQLPASMARVLFEDDSFTSLPPLPEDDYLRWGLRIDRLYQAAARWIMLEPYLAWYSQKKTKDIRGYYFLSIEPDLADRLAHFGTLNAGIQSRLKSHLESLCFNFEAGGSKTCFADLEVGMNKGDLTEFYNLYSPLSKAIYDGFFKIGIVRPEYKWSDNTLNIPFQDPMGEDLRDFFKTNVEDEWRLGDSQLMVSFSSAENLAKMIFLPGVTPHVNYLGGDEIVMDANTPITEYNAQWTIRHEFGHILGFPDCYVEFYDEAEQVMINYQIDIENLMCSRRGHILQKHFDELKSAYGSN